MTKKVSPRRPGRPRGPGFPSDRQRLDRIADALINGAPTLAAAMRSVGIEEEADVRRLHRHFKNNRSELLNAASARAQRARRQDRAPPAVQPLSGIDLARLIDPLAHLRPLMKQLVCPPYMESMQRIAKQLDANRDAYRQAMQQFDRHRPMIERMTAEFTQSARILEQMLPPKQVFDTWTQQIQRAASLLPPSITRKPRR